MSQKPDGGPAFPCDSREARQFAGMTLRQYYAAAALTGVLADPNAASNPKELAIYCFNVADAMIAHEREGR